MQMSFILCAPCTIVLKPVLFDQLNSVTLLRDKVASVSR